MSLLTNKTINETTSGNHDASTNETLYSTVSTWNCSTEAFNTTEALITGNVTIPWQNSEAKSPRFILLLGLLPMILMTVIANILVMVVIKTDRKLQITSNWYIFSLAVADAIVGLTVMTPFTVYNIYEYWPWDIIPCTIWVCLDFGCCTVSMLHLCLIAFDRLMCITKPHSYVGDEAKHRTVLGIILAWILGLAVWLPAVVLFRQKDITDGTMDKLDCLFFPPKEYILVQSIIVYFGPIFAMIILYAELLTALKEKEKRIKQYTKQKSNGEPKSYINKAFNNVEESDGSISDDNKTRDETKQKNKSKAEIRMAKQNRRSVKVIGVVIFTFLVCWLPFCVFWPVAAFCETCIHAKLYEASYWMAYINSLVNPLLYFIVNRDFRGALFRLCGFRCCVKLAARSETSMSNQQP